MRTIDAAGLAIGDGHPTRIMGVLNVSKESPYKPSVFDDHAQAAAFVDEELIGEGADIVDIGLESANKKFDVLSAEGELDRLETALETVASVSGDAVFSIETRYHEVATAALDGGFDMVNDICGFADPEMPRVCREYDVAVGKMASPPDLERPGAVERPDDIYEALSQNGMTEKTIVDPAFGGWSEDKTVADDRETFRRLPEFRSYGQPILVSINRKNFLREMAGRDTDGALPVSLAATAMAIDRGVHVVRTHDVAETRDAAIVGDRFRTDRLRRTELGLEEVDVRTPEQAARQLAALGAEASHADGLVQRCYILRDIPNPDVERLEAATDGSVGFARAATGVDGLLYGSASGLVDLCDRLSTADLGTRTARVLDAIATEL